MAAAVETFSKVPILSLAAARSPDTKPAFLAQLRDALITVGFMYISDTGLPQELVEKVVRQTQDFFDEDKLPFEEKEKIEMKNEKSFLGWSRVRAIRVFKATIYQGSSSPLNVCFILGLSVPLNPSPIAVVGNPKKPHIVSGSKPQSIITAQAAANLW